MKLKTVLPLYNKGLTIWDGTVVNFNSSGLCDVKDSIGNTMLEKYPSMVFPEDFEKEKPKTREQDFTKGYAEQLQRELEYAKEESKARKNEAEINAADRDSWAEKVGELVKEKNSAVTQLSKEKESFSNQVKYFELRIALMETSVAGLKKTCETASFPKEEWSSLSQPKLIEYILSKS